MSSNFWRNTSDSIDIERVKSSFIKDFKYIMSLGFVESHRSHNTGIGKTLEDLMKIEENNLSLPDYKGCIELKSQRDSTASMLSIFTKSPSYPPKANTVLREKYGYPDAETGHNIIHTTIKYSNFNNFKNKWGFNLRIDENRGRLYLLIKDLKTNTVQSFRPYWDFKELNNKIKTKCSVIAYITAETKIINGIEKFRFKKAILLSGLTLQRFLDFIKKDKIFFDIRIGVYRSGKSIGKSHDHGSGFRIRRKDIPNIFDVEEISLDEHADSIELMHDNKLSNKLKEIKNDELIQRKITDYKKF